LIHVLYLFHFIDLHNLKKYVTKLRSFGWFSQLDEYLTIPRCKHLVGLVSWVNISLVHDVKQLVGLVSWMNI